MNKDKIRSANQLCWGCKKCTGGCAWADFLKPVKGWDAVLHKRVHKGVGYTSYAIKGCPEFEKDEPIISKEERTVQEIAIKSGKSVRTVQRWMSLLKAIQGVNKNGRN